MRVVNTLYVVILVFSAAFGGAIFKQKPVASPSGSAIIVRWESLDESSIDRFEVWRKSYNKSEFTFVSIVPKMGDNKSYEYLDQQVFKNVDGIYVYEIRGMSGENIIVRSDLATVSHVSSAAKRTWGSIKAMFR